MPSYFSKKHKKSSDEKSPILKWLGRFFMGIGVMVFISFTISVVSLAVLFSGKAEVKPLASDFILVEKLQGTKPETNTVHPLVAEFIPQPTTLYGFLTGLKAAKNDDRVTHFVTVIEDGDYSLSQIQTIRNAVIDFRSSGKKTIIYTDNFGGFSNGIGEYWLATAFDEIWLNPLGLASLMGIRIEQPYLKDALGKIGVDFELEARKDYKTGGETYTRSTMSPENRETLKAIIDDMMNVMIADIATARDVTDNEIKALINQSPLLADVALQSGLVDKIGHLDELEDLLKGEDGKDRDNIFVGMKRYSHETPRLLPKDKANPKIAIVNIDGMIIDADMLARANHPLAFVMPDTIADSTIIASAIRDVADNDDIEVMVLRVNSPGGTPDAAEKIRRAVLEAKEKGKYVIASFADVAASGGYWVAVDADEIISDNLTLTGSIGVYGGKPDLSGLWDMIGVNWQSMQYGDHAGIWSTSKGMSEGERRRFSAMMDSTYNAFIARVAQGRGMTVQDVEMVAQGRAWTGLDAITGGLVDSLGGFEIALAKAATKIGAEDWTRTRMITLPQDDDPFDDFLSFIGIPSLGLNMPQIPAIALPMILDNTILTAPNLRVEF